MAVLTTGSEPEMDRNWTGSVLKVRASQDHLAERVFLIFVGSLVPCVTCKGSSFWLNCLKDREKNFNILLCYNTANFSEIDIKNRVKSGGWAPLGTT